MSTELARIPADTDIEPLPMPLAAVAVLDRTPNATFAAEEFFKAKIGNDHTKRAYGRLRQWVI